MPTDPILFVQTRLPASMASALIEQAARNERSVAAELRVAVRAHLNSGAPADTEAPLKTGDVTADHAQAYANG